MLRKKVWFIVLFIAGGFFSLIAQSVLCADDEILFINKGHTIRVDKDIGDWVGLPPLQENTAVVDKGEYIWKDAKGDDVGDGNYVYPTNEKLRKGADIREVRITYDEKKLYLMIRTDRPNDWWVGYKIIGIDKDGAGGGTSGTTVLAQGDIDLLSTYNGCYGELKVAEELACEIIIGISSTWRVRIWDKEGKLIAAVDGEERQVPGVKVADCNWYAIELSLPYDIIGDPRGETWRFIVGTGLQDGDYFREVYSKPQDEWHPGGSRESSSLEDGVDPDVLDLIGASREKQIEDLASYDPEGEPGDIDSFCTIKNSYITVRFGK